MNSTLSWIDTSSSQIFVRQVLGMLKANLKARYRKTWAGFFWVVCNPLIMYGVQSLIFSKVLKLEVQNYYVFLLSGLLPWLFIVQALEMCTPLFQYSGPLLKAYPAHPLVYLTAQLLDNFINFCAAFAILIVGLLLSEVEVPRLYLLPLPLMFLIFFVYSWAVFFSTTQVFLRDTRYILTFVLNISFFLTPIFYPVHFLPDNLIWMMDFNPFYAFIAPFRVALHDFNWPDYWDALGKAAQWSLVWFGISTFYWRKRRNDLYFNI